MADSAPAETKTEPAKPTLEALVKKYQSLTDNKERAEFYKANPALAQVYSQSNHS